jgi:IS5 family transposase
MLKRNTQLTFGMLEDAARPQKHTMLDEIERMVDWRPLERALETLYAKESGRPAIPPIMLLKALLLESWYNLSDVAVAQEIHDRRSFERFIGMDVRRYQIDDSTLVRFRERLRAGGAEERVLRLVAEQLERHGVMVRNATIIDATLVKAATRPQHKKQDGTPVDEDVKTTVRNRQPVDGMKVHVSMDRETEFIEEVRLTRITVHDHEVFEELIPPTARAVYADKGYASAAHRAWLDERDMRDRIFYKATCRHGLAARERDCNRRWGRVRNAIERVIGVLKHRCSLARLRYIGLRRNWTQVRFAVMAYNLKRLAAIG